MTERYQKIGCIVIACCSAAHAVTPVAPYVSVRSFSASVSRAQVGCHDLVNRHDAHTLYANFFVQPGYTHSLRSPVLAHLLFGDALVGGCRTERSSCHPRVRITGSHVSNRASTDLCADYFGLPVDFESELTVDPSICNFFCDMNLYFGLDDWYPGLYFQIFAPFVHTRWELNACERVANRGVKNHLPGYMSDAIVSQTVGVPRVRLLESFADFAVSGTAPVVGGSVIWEPLKNALMRAGGADDNRVAELGMIFGWNLLCTDDYHIGLYLCSSAPTGTRPTGVLLFEPVVGNGRHWQLGAGLQACYQLWSSQDEHSSVSAFLDFNMSHLFNARQWRTFDVGNKPLSRYMLVERMTCNVQNLLDPDGNSPCAQFDNVLLPLANASTLPVRVRADFQTDLSLLFAYTCGHFTADVGYNFFNRTPERIQPCYDPCSTTYFFAHQWALKGDSFVYGFTLNGGGNLETPIALSATQADATINAGTNKAPDGIDGVAWNRNPGVDNKKLAQRGDPAADLYTKSYAGVAGTVYSSFNPRLIGINDLDTTGTKLQTHSFFFNLSHTWDHRPDITPYLGVGAQVEMGLSCVRRCKPEKGCATQENCTACRGAVHCAGLDTSVSLVAVWLKGGVAFK